jgi:hypothetical protein
VPVSGRASDFDGSGLFRGRTGDRWLDEVPFTRDQLATYLMTQSNVLDAAESPDAVRAWLLAELAPFAGADPRPLSFRASYQLLERTP